VEARCDGKICVSENELPKRPHLRMNYGVSHKCVRSSHRQGCSPHSPLQESERIPDFRFYLDADRSTAEKGLDSRKRRVRQLAEEED